MGLSQKQQLIAIVVGFALLLGGEGYLTTRLLGERGKLHAQLKDLDRQEREAKAKISQIPKLRESAESLAQIIEEYAEILPTELEVGTDAFLEDIEGFMEDTQLIMITGAPAEEKVRRSGKIKGQRADDDNFRQHKYKFELEGTLFDFMKFVNRVENHTRFLEILDVNIEPRGMERSRVDPSTEISAAADPRKSIEVVISTYTYSRVKRDSGTDKNKKS